MRICVTAKHRYPAGGTGPSGGHIFDLLVRGLAELGHEVFYRPQLGTAAPLPPGVAFVEQPVWDVEIVHCRIDEDVHREAQRRGIPWVASCHADLLTTWGRDRSAATRNWIYASQTLARTYGSSRFVRYGIDPGEFMFSRTKRDYLLFISMLRFAKRKGLDTALALSRTLNFPLVVAGACDDVEVVDRVARQCREAGVEFVGAVVGRKKAELFAAGPRAAVSHGTERGVRDHAGRSAHFRNARHLQQQRGLPRDRHCRRRICVRHRRRLSPGAAASR